MLPPSVVNEIRRLLTGEGLSYREIVRITGVSRGTVGLIARGKRPDYEARRVARGDDPLEPTGPPQRCPGCGGLVYLPCRLCDARKLVGAKREMGQTETARGGATEEAFELQLKEEHRRRYEDVRARRERAEMEAAPEPVESLPFAIDPPFSIGE